MFKQVIQEVEVNPLKYLLKPTREWVSELFDKNDDYEVVVTNSGKAALCLILRYYKSIGKIKNKNDEIWTPKWIGAWVYNIIQKVCFPSLSQSENTRGILVYHQYGFPQKIEKIKQLADEKGWFLIEDCAHAILSYQNGKRLGLLGDAAIFSFSKFFPSIMGGALVTRDKKLAEFVRAEINNSSFNRWVVGNIAFFSKWAFLCKYLSPFKRFFNHWVEMTYAVYDAIPKIHIFANHVIGSSIKSGALNIRKKNCEFYFKELRNIGHLNRYEIPEVLPYVVPLILPVDTLMRIAKEFKTIGVLDSIYHFDVNQDMTNPQFEKCLFLPVHPGVTEEIKKKIVDIIKREAK